MWNHRHRINSANLANQTSPSAACRRCACQGNTYTITLSVYRGTLHKVLLNTIRRKYMERQNCLANRSCATAWTLRCVQCNKAEIHVKQQLYNTGRCRVMLRSIFGSSPPSPTRRPDKDSGLHPPIICLFLLSRLSTVLDVAPSLLLVLAYGTIYPRTLPPHQLCLHLSVV